MSTFPSPITVRPTRADDIESIIALCRRVYPESVPWSHDQLESHLARFPEGQFVAEKEGIAGVVGMAATLIIRWDDYEATGSWRDFTDAGMFTNHDPANGMTLYGAEVMVDPAIQRCGIGGLIYRERRELAIRLGLKRIRAAARLRGYSRHAAEMPAETYVQRIIRGELQDPTLSFQLRHGFHVLQVVSGYLRSDPESLGYAAVIEWLNPAVATAADMGGGDPRFRPPGTSAP